MKNYYKNLTPKSFIPKLLVFLIPTILIFSCSKNEVENVAPESKKSINATDSFARLAEKIKSLKNLNNSNSKISNTECVDTAQVKAELNAFLNDEFQIAEEEGYQEIFNQTNYEIKTHSWGTQNEDGTVNIISASEKENYYANKYVAAIGEEAKSFTELNEDAEDLSLFTSNLENRFAEISAEIESDSDLSETERLVLEKSHSVIVTTLPSISDLCTSIAYCTGSYENGKLAGGFGSFLKKTVNLVASVVTTVVTNVIPGVIIGAAVGGTIGGPAGALVGAVVGAILGAVLGLGQGLILGLSCKCVWKFLPCFGC